MRAMRAYDAATAAKIGKDNLGSFRNRQSLELNHTDICFASQRRHPAPGARIRNVAKSIYHEISCFEEPSPN
jgi:hypothetical protein